ncbi:hypothetical protein ACFYOF_17090 [Streptomyces sp. NPDC007148]|uniref:hypothetical protein n=1 Tax=Streptomyces sp. NPDC007148 TaxID=3364775 RepID=UPI00368AAE32
MGEVLGPDDDPGLLDLAAPVRVRERGLGAPGDETFISAERASAWCAVAAGDDGVAAVVRAGPVVVPGSAVVEVGHVGVLDDDTGPHEPEDADRGLDLVRAGRVDLGECDRLHAVRAAVLDEVLEQGLDVHAAVGRRAGAVDVGVAVRVEARVLGAVDLPHLVLDRVVLGAGDVGDKPADVGPGDRDTVTGDIVAEHLPRGQASQVVGRDRMSGDLAREQPGESERRRGLRGASAVLA